MTDQPTPERPEPDHTIADDSAAAAAAAGMPGRIGGFRIIRRLGEGGMGAVFEAQQDSPRRIVALKVVNAGIASEAMLRRFEHEANYLARLQHPGIAQVYEAGTFDSGRGRQPWFAMELVRGQPLNKYAAAKNLDLRARLGLIARICQAVHHAHQKGVIHRDLKPDNILITEDGEPKILDFGVARATDSDLQVTTIQTDIGQLIGTIPYMSPEQAGGNPEDLDTRSDVYALGVIAYELLAGRLPYDLRQRVIHEAVRIIREEEPTRLSSINRTLRGDVEIIVGKALEKEKERRYQSASDLASDIEHYLNDEPIEARPPSAAYQLRKFARRNQALVGGVGATFVVLVLGIIGTGTFALRAEARRVEAVEAQTRAERAEDDAEQRADELEQVAAFQESQLSEIDAELMGVRLRRDLIDRRRGALESRRLGEPEVEAALAEFEKSLAGINFTDTSLKTLDENVFERAMKTIDERFEDQPLMKARLLQVVANTLRTLGRLDLATGPQEEAHAIRRRVLGDDHPDTLTSINEMGFLLQAHGELAEAEPYCLEALEARRRILGNEHPDTLISISNMGALLDALGKLVDAEPYYREALETGRRVLGDEHPNTLISISNLGFLLGAQGKLAEAEPYFREALETRRRVLGDEHPDTLGSINNMGALLDAQGKLGEAGPFYLEALESSRRVLGDEHPDTLVSINNMGFLFQAQGNLVEAEPYFREALETRRRVLGDEHPDTLTSINNMGALLTAQDKLAEAEPYYREALEGFRRVLGDEHPHTLGSTNGTGFLLQAQGKLAEAEPYYREALETSRRILGDEHPDTLISISNLGGLLRDLGQLEEAERLGAEAVTTVRRVLPEGHWHSAIFLGHHARTLAALGRFAEAEGRYLETHAILEAAFGPDHDRTTGTVNAVADLYDAWHAAEPDAGHGAKAEQWRARLDVIPAPAESDQP